MKNLYLLQFKILSQLFFQDEEGRGEAAAVQTPLEDLPSKVFFGFGRMSVGHAQNCARRGVLTG